LIFVDSHLHLSEYGDAAQPLALARGRALLFSAAVDRASAERTLSVSAMNPDEVRAFVGVHPSEATREEPGDWLATAVGRAAGVGEIGLDPKYSEVSPRSRQMSLFLGQLELAEKAGKPVQVHSRGAEAACIEALETFSIPRVQLHWFQGESLARRASDRGYYASFGPALIESRKLKRMAANWERERLLAESDGPVGFPGLGGSGGPALIPSVVFALGEALSMSFEDANELVRRNSVSFLREKA
jgi:TatD DNase family protein